MNEGNYYQGAGLNISEAVHAELRAGQVSYDGAAVERAVASGAQAQQGLVDEVQRLQDYQEGAEAMRKLRELRGRQEGKLRAGLEAAPGTKQSLLRENGEVDEEKFDAFMQTARDEVERVRPRFWSPQRLVRYEQEYADFAEETERHVKGLVAGHMTAGVRRAGRAALEEAEKLGDVLGYQRELRNQVDAGVLTETEARVKMMEFNERSYAKVQDEEYKMQMERAVTDPDGVLLEWSRGGMGDMDPVRAEKVRATAERAAAMRAQQEEFTEKERAVLEAGGVVKPRFKVRNGATEQEWKWRAHYHEHGTYGKFVGEITGAFNEELAAAPVPQDKADADAWVNYMVKKWADPQMGYGLDEYNVRVLCNAQMKEWLAANQEQETMRFSMRGLLDSVSDAQIVPWAEAQARYRREEFKKDDADDKALRDEADKLVKDRRARVEHDAMVAMTRWMESNSTANYSQCYEQGMKYLLKYSEMYDLEIDMETDRWDGDYEAYQNEARDMVDYQREKIEADDTDGSVFTVKAGEDGRAAQAEAHEKWRSGQKAMVLAERAEVPERVLRIGRVESDVEEMVVPDAVYKKLQQKFGEAPVAHVTLPGSRAYLRVKVRAGDVQEVSLSDTAMVRLNNVLAKQASVRFGSSPEAVKEQGNQAAPAAEVVDDGLVPVDEAGNVVPEEQNYLFPDENGN